MKLKSLVVGLMFVSLHLPLGAEVAAPPAPASPATRTFSSAAAAAAQRAYVASVDAAQLKYAGELDQAIKAALAAGNLDDANAINVTRQKLTPGSVPATGVAFKTAQAEQARRRFETAVVAAQRQYSLDLQLALKAVMNAGNLTESNLINSEIKTLATITASAAPAVAPPPVGQSARVNKGLEIVRYRKLPTQTENYQGYVPYTELGKPLGAAHIEKSISSWTKDVNENVVVSGFIRIDQPGTYEFRTDSGFDRNELLVNNEIVCKFRDGTNKPQSIQLAAGMIPIVSVGYALATTEVRVQWKPPGQADWSAIPNELLYH